MDIVTFSAGLSPVPPKVIKQIQDGEYVDLAKLTIDHLSMPSLSNASKSIQTRVRPVASIMECTQCFTNYIAICGYT